jgi:hypothetical protein
MMPKEYVSRGGKPITASAAKFHRCDKLPYGKWTTTSGREVLFSRFYEPLYEKVDGQVKEADPKEWVEAITKQVYFYNGRARAEEGVTELAQAALADWGIRTQDIGPRARGMRKPRSLKEDQQRVYDELKRFNEVFFDQYTSEGMDVPREVHPSFVLDAMAKVSPARAFKGLKMSTADCLEMSGHWGLEQVQQADQTLSAAGATTLTDMRLRLAEIARG